MTLDEAIVALVDEFSLGDFIYNVRENLDLRDFKGNSWDHPRVMRFSDAVVALTVRAKEIKNAAS